MADKETVRSIWRKILAETSVVSHWGKAAEKLRRMGTYRTAATIFSTPSEALHQARINCLVDGKNLVMPAPSMREGFYLLPACTIPFKDIPFAVTYKGLAKNGLLLKGQDISGLSIGILLTDSLSVDNEGGRIGNGQGFFDLCCALLNDLGYLQPGWAALTIIGEEQISRESLPRNKWDIKMTGTITPVRILQFKPPPQKPQIYWDILDRARINRINPLWKLFQKRKAEGTLEN